MMSKRFVSLTVLAVCLCPVFASAQGTSGSQFLGIGMGARAMGMGGASVSVVNDGSSLYWNPAGLTGLTFRSASISHVSWLDDASYQYATFAAPLGSSYFGLALEQGGIEWDNTGDGTFDASDFSGAAAYARRLRPNLGVGAGVKFLSSSLGDDGASSFALDLGVTYRLSESATLGAVVRNLGPGMSFVDESDPLPATMAAGASYRFRNVLVALDVEKVNDLQAATRLGVEYSPVRYVALRAGGILEGDSALSALTGGVGFNWDDRWALDYAYRPSDLGGTHWLALSAGFGGAAPAPEAAIAVGGGGQALREVTVPVSNITMLGDLVRDLGRSAFAKMVLPEGSEVYLRQVETHDANWLVQSIFLEELTSSGHAVKTGSMPGGAMANGAAVPGAGEASTGRYEIAYRIVSCEVTYPRVWREWLVGSRKVERRSSADIHFQLLDEDKSVVWAGSESRERRDIVPGSRIADLSTPGQAFTAPELEAAGWDKVIEPVVVAGIVGGLIYLFYTSKSSQ
jgi:hypothetical protein